MASASGPPGLSLSNAPQGATGRDGHGGDASRDRAGFAWRAALLLTSGAWVSSAAAQGDAAAGWPKQPVRIVVGFAAGGGNDIQARVVGQKLAERLGQPVVVENKAGAGGNIAAESVARSAPDGTTLLMSPAATLVINPAVYSKLPYDPVASFAPVVQVSAFQIFLAVAADHPAKSASELVAWGRANPAKANYGAPATTFQLTAEIFNLKTGSKFVYIPFKSSTENITGLLTGQVAMAFVDPGPLMAHVAAGKVRLLATTGEKRWPYLPDVPTTAEIGLPDVVSVSFSGLVAPKGTPAAIVKKLADEVNVILKMPDVAERFKALGLMTVGGTPEAFAAVIAREIPRWTAVAKAANVKLD